MANYYKHYPRSVRGRIATWKRQHTEGVAHCKAVDLIEQEAPCKLHTRAGRAFLNYRRNTLTRTS